MLNLIRIIYIWLLRREYRAEGATLKGMRTIVLMPSGNYIEIPLSID